MPEHLESCQETWQGTHHIWQETIENMRDLKSTLNAVYAYAKAFFEN